MRSRLVSARLLTLLALVRGSAELRYRREIALTELNRRIVSLAGDRNAALTRDIGGPALERFTAMTARLIDRAALLLARERESEVSAAPDRAVEDPAMASPMPERLRTEAGDGAPARVLVPPLITLSAYLSRSATIAYRRETGLSNFTWRVMAQIGEHQPVALAALIGLMHRDKSQVGRAVKWLEGEGLVGRAALARQRDVMLACTAEGDALYAEMCGSARRRDDFLFAGRDPEERDAYIAGLDTFTANSARLLAEERAIR